MIQGALGNIKHDFLLRDWITQQKMEEKKKKKAPYPATSPMIVNQSIIANMPGLRVENVVCFQPILQFNKFYGYETHSTYSQKA